jgi:hypothetical protein
MTFGGPVHVKSGGPVLNFQGIYLHQCVRCHRLTGERPRDPGIEFAKREGYVALHGAGVLAQRRGSVSFIDKGQAREKPASLAHRVSTLLCYYRFF